MNPTEPLQAEVWEDTGLVVIGRLRGNSGAMITQASIAAIVCKVFDRSNNDALVATRELEVNDVVFDSLQTSDARWTEDSTGFNFLDEVEATAFPDGSRTYQLEYVFTPASGQQFAFVAVVDTKNLLSS